MQKKSKKAFTLVEMMIVIALVGIVSLLIVSMMGSAANATTELSNEAQAKMKASQVMQVIIPQVRYATNLQLINDSSQIGKTSGYEYLYTSNYKVYLYKSGSATDMFGTSFYNNYQVSLSFNVTSAPDTVQIKATVTLPSKSTINSVLTTSVQNLNATSIAGSGNILMYQWLTAPPSSP